MHDKAAAVVVKGGVRVIGRPFGGGDEFVGMLRLQNAVERVGKLGAVDAEGAQLRLGLAYQQKHDGAGDAEDEHDKDDHQRNGAAVVLFFLILFALALDGLAAVGAGDGIVGNAVSAFFANSHKSPQRHAGRKRKPPARCILFNYKACTWIVSPSAVT